MHSVDFGYAPTYLSTRHCDTTFNAMRKSASAFGRQWTVQCTTDVTVSWF